MTRTNVSIIIVNWNSRDYLQQCINSILRHTQNTSYEIIVIDSASFDGCDQMLHEQYPQVRFIQSATNCGFAKANNRAFQDAVGEYILFLNPDTELKGPAIDTMYCQAESLPDGGAIGCRLLNSDGTVQLTCIRATPTILNRLLDSDVLRRRWPRSRLWGTAPLHEHEPGPREVEAISGACLMVSRRVFEQIDRFSEDYFMYAEDIDLSYKSRMAGFKNYYIPEAIIVHHGGSSSEQTSNGFAAVMMPEATWRFFRKTRGPAYAGAFKLGMLVSSACRLLVLELASRFLLTPGPSWASSLRKSRAVLKWSLNRDELVRRYYPESDPHGSCLN